MPAFARAPALAPSRKPHARFDPWRTDAGEVVPCVGVPCAQFILGQECVEKMALEAEFRHNLAQE